MGWFVGGTSKSLGSSDARRRIKNDGEPSPDIRNQARAFKFRLCRALVERDINERNLVDTQARAVQDGGEEIQEKSKSCLKAGTTPREPTGTPLCGTDRKAHETPKSWLSQALKVEKTKPKAATNFILCNGVDPAS